MGIVPIGFSLDLAAAAITVMGKTGLGGILGILKNTQQQPTFSAVVRAWALEISDWSEDENANAGLPFDLIPSAVLLLCAFELIEPELEEKPGRESILIVKPASPRLARRLYQEIAEGRVVSPLQLRGFK
mmetsp:Transcript_62029/g.124367  ORF Transcript_62029/g.124367 Transcript_62029/m.124367 type:complete len:130 (+) Transcript_62029:1268-1657(+)